MYNCIDKKREEKEEAKKLETRITILTACLTATSAGKSMRTMLNAKTRLNKTH